MTFEKFDKFEINVELYYVVSTFPEVYQVGFKTKEEAYQFIEEKEIGSFVNLIHGTELETYYRFPEFF
jgi:hypothetical protein